MDGPTPTIVNRERNCLRVPDQIEEHRETSGFFSILKQRLINIVSTG
jgi:hypothetical protein